MPALRGVLEREGQATLRGLERSHTDPNASGAPLDLPASSLPPRSLVPAKPLPGSPGPCCPPGQSLREGGTASSRKAGLPGGAGRAQRGEERGSGFLVCLGTKISPLQARSRGVRPSQAQALRNPRRRPKPDGEPRAGRLPGSKPHTGVSFLSHVVFRSGGVLNGAVFMSLHADVGVRL